MNNSEHIDWNARTKRIAISVLTLTMAVCMPCVADESGSGRTNRATALNDVFGEYVLSRNGGAVRQRARAMTPARRFEYLRQWVLFSDQRPAIRMQIDFTSANPVPSVAGDMPSSGRRVQFGAELVAPAIDLVETARQLDRLNELHTDVENWVPPDDRQRKCRAAFLAAIAMAQRRFDDAGQWLQQVFRLAQSVPIVAAERGPEAIAAWSAGRWSATRDAARDLIFLLYEQARNKQGPRSERWHRHVYSQKQAFEHQAEFGTDVLTAEPDSSNELNHWFPVSRMTAETCGKGYPLSGWYVRAGSVQHVTAHDNDYLYYAIPLSGSFAVEADITTFSYRDIHLGYGGIWAGPGYDLKSCLTGSFQRFLRSEKIDPPLSQTGDWMRVRLVVEDGVRTTFINGRKVFEYDHTPDTDPWLAIHSDWYAGGTARNLAVTGNPVVPEEISMVVSPNLPGWLPYFEESAGQPDSDWHQTVAADGTPVLVRRRLPFLGGTHFESLLQYHRPMVEDGSVEYEFFYDARVAEVSPALGRLAFLLTPSGLREHWILDGRFERSKLDPANSTAAARGQDTDSFLPLRMKAWNHMRVTMVGDSVRLHLNNTLICTRQLEPANQRTFGLFLFADQTEARVRNVRWKGNWPKKLPQISRQELVDDPMEMVNSELAGLPTVLNHDFSRGLPADQFRILKGAPGAQISEEADGVHVTRPGGDGYLNIAIAPRFRLEGDFVVTAEFENFEASPTDDGNGNVHLYTAIDDKVFSECRIFRRTTAGSRKIESSVFRRIDDRTRYLFPKSTAEESTSGKTAPYSPQNQSVLPVCGE